MSDESIDSAAVERYDESSPLALRGFWAKLDWWEEQVAPALSSDAGLDTMILATAVAIRESLALRSRRLGSLLPGIESLEDVVLQPSYYCRLGTRCARLLRSNGADEWGALAERSAAELCAWRECGPSSVQEILEGAVGAWVELEWAGQAVFPVREVPHRPPLTWWSERLTNPRNAAGSGPVSTSDLGSDARVRATSALRMLCGAAYAAGAANIGEAMAFATSESASDDWLSRTWARFCEVPLHELLGIDGRTEPAWEALLRFREREVRIIEARCALHPARQTLAALGRELGVSGGRISQIEQRCSKAIANRLSKPQCAPIVHVAARLRRQIGTLVPADACDGALDALIAPQAPHQLLRRAIVLEEAGPYRLEDGFWQTGHPLAQLKAALSAHPDARMSDAELDRLMHDAGVAAVHHEACRAALGIDGPVSGEHDRTER